MRVVSTEKLIDFIREYSYVGSFGFGKEEQEDNLVSWIEDNLYKTEDFCHWEHNYDTGYYETSCGAIYKDCDEEHCPYCGRKIELGGNEGMIVKNVWLVYYVKGTKAVLDTAFMDYDSALKHKEILEKRHVADNVYFDIKVSPIPLVDFGKENDTMTEVTEVKTTKKAMISQPMSGKSREEILKERESAASYLEGLGYEVVDTVFDISDASMDVFGVKVKPVYYLSQAIREMSKCDLVYFCKGWENARGCAIEFNIANAYGINTMY